MKIKTTKIIKIVISSKFKRKKVGKMRIKWKKRSNKKNYLLFRKFAMIRLLNKRKIKIIIPKLRFNSILITA